MEGILMSLLPIRSQRQKAGKPHFGSDLGLLGPKLGHEPFWKISALLDVRHCPRLHSCAISWKTYDAP